MKRQYHTTTRQNHKLFARLAYLGKMISKYAHCWSEYPSSRLSNWVWEYDEIRNNHRQVFYAYCEKYGFNPDHNGYDYLA